MRILFIGAPIGPPPNAKLTLQQKFEYTGRNTGNLLIGQSIFEELKFSSHAFGTQFSPSEAMERFDFIVVAAANFLFRNFDFSYLADFIEGVQLPCMMVGLGAQAPRIGDRTGNIPEGTKRLLSVVSERSKSIGVRGEYTASVMTGLGFRNVDVTGCPSLYRTLKRQLKVKRLPHRSGLRLSLNGSRNVVEHAGCPRSALNVEAKLLQASIKNGYNYVLQNETPEMAVAYGEPVSEEMLYLLNHLAKRFRLPVSGAKFAQHIQEKCKLFFDLNSWDEYIRAFDGSVGSRFHGNVMALTNGVPAFVLTHDSRTTEMCEFAHIPHASVEEITQLDPEALLASADFDKFESRYPVLYDNFGAFLTKNGLAHKLTEHPSSPDGRSAHL